MTTKDVEEEVSVPDATSVAKSDEKQEGGTDANINSNNITDDNEENAIAPPATNKFTSHMRNELHPAYVRWGILFFLLGTFVLLVCADFGSGVTAESILIQDGEIVDRIEILNVSVVSSVGKLWEAESYPLAIFIAITSIGWPYIKLALATLAWLAPYSNPRRREFFIEIIDALGKWSFVDVMVLVEIMVAFRSSQELATDVLFIEIIIVAQWGFYGFVAATIMSLSSTHIILHYHRKLHYHQMVNTTSTTIIADNVELGDSTSSASDKNDEKRGMKILGGLSNGFMVSAIACLVVSIIVFLAGVTVPSFEVTATNPQASKTDSYSIASIGMAIPEAYIDPSHAGTRFIQFMWFFLGIAMPLLCSVLFLVLYATPSLSKKWMEIIFTSAEIAFAWSCAEVLFISTIFAVKQMPVFGDGLVENNCTTCFLIDTKILGTFSILCIGTILNVGVNVWLYRKAHSIIYPPSSHISPRNVQ